MSRSIRLLPYLILIWSQKLKNFNTTKSIKCSESNYLATAVRKTIEIKKINLKKGKKLNKTDRKVEKIKEQLTTTNTKKHKHRRLIKNIN